jgi:gas vesicle protein
MRNKGSRHNAKDWARLALKLGLLLTEPKVRAAVGEQLKNRVDQVTETVASKYEDAMDRLEAAGAALQGRSYRPSRIVGFLLGVGVGAGLGILFAPASGSETREAIRGRAVDMKNKVVESASTATRKMRHSVTSMPPTGTEG